MPTDSEVPMFHAPVICHRLFFALRPPLVLARQVTQAAHWFEDGRGVLRPEHVHVTLDLLDDLPVFDRDLAKRMLDVGAGVAADPFHIVLDRVVGSSGSIALRPGHRLPALHALCDEIVRQRGAAGIAGREGYRFNPHVTLGYRKGIPFNEAIAPVTWPVEDFVLIHSHVGAGRHDVLGRWALDGKDVRQGSLF